MPATAEGEGRGDRKDQCCASHPPEHCSRRCPARREQRLNKWATKTEARSRAKREQENRTELTLRRSGDRGQVLSLQE